MPQIQAPLPATFGTVGNRAWSVMRPVNCFLQPAEFPTKTATIIQPTSGLKFRVTPGGGEIRGGMRWQGDAYWVSGDRLYKHERDDTVTALGGVRMGGTGPVVMAANSTQICIVEPSTRSGYVASGDPMTVKRISDIDLDFAGAASVDVLDSIAIFEIPDSDEFFISAVDDFTNISALDFAAAERNPDRNVRVLVDHAELWIFGEETIEVFQNVGGTFPFRRLPGGIIERGCAARFSVAKDDNTVFWLGDDGIFYRATDYTPTRISNHAVEEVIEGQITSDAECTHWTEAGSKFVSWRFPSIGRCLVYDISTGLWHERASGTQAENVWAGRFAVEIWGKSLIGATDGNIYELDRSTYQDNGAVKRAEMTFGPVYGEGRRIRHLSLDVEMEVGRGLVSGQGSDPQIMMNYSDDGSTWSNELWRSIGARGEYKTRVRWNRLGSSYERTYRLAITDPVPWAVMDAKLRVSGGR